MVEVERKSTRLQTGGNIYYWPEYERSKQKEIKGNGEGGGKI